MGFAAGDKNLYRYVSNSPTNATDPSGLAEIPWKNLTANPDVCGSGKDQNPNLLEATATDKNGTVLERFCDGAQFIYRVKSGLGRQTVGLCIPVGGYNKLQVEFDGKGNFKSLVHYNIGPTGDGRKVQDTNRQISNAVNKALAELRRTKPNAGIEDERKTIEATLWNLRGLLTSRKPTEEEKKAGLSPYNSVVFVTKFSADGKTVEAIPYRLCFDENAANPTGFVLREDEALKKLLRTP